MDKQRVESVLLASESPYLISAIISKPFFYKYLILQRDLSGLRLPSTLTIDLKRTLPMAAIGRIVAHLMIPDDVKGPIEIENLLPQGDGQQRPRLWHS